MDEAEFIGTSKHLHQAPDESSTANHFVVTELPPGAHLFKDDHNRDWKGCQP